jgi:hypothetical protein
VVGHTTAEELKRNLDDVQIASGLANRFVFFCVQRSKLLPDGGILDDELLTVLATGCGRPSTASRGTC